MKIILTICVLLDLCLLSFCNPDAKRLYDDLLSNYNRLIRPVSNNTDTVLVKLGLRLSQLIELVRKCLLLQNFNNGIGNMIITENLTSEEIKHILLVAG